MVPPRHFSALEEIPLFANLTTAEVERMNERAHSRKFQAGAQVITADQSGEALYVVLSGSVKIQVDQIDGSTVTFAILGPGQIIGELSMIDDSSRSANVVTMVESNLLWIDRRDFREFLDASKALCQNLVAELSFRLRQANRQIEALSSLDVTARVARQILALSEAFGEEDRQGRTRILIALTQTDIAELVGATRERVNKAFVALKKRKILAVSRDHRITILDPEALSAEAKLADASPSDLFRDR